MVWMMLAERKELQGKLSHADKVLTLSQTGKVLPLYDTEEVLPLSQAEKMLPLVGTF